MSLAWNGDEIKRNWLEAAKRGIDKTMSQCVISSKSNHPGWQNRTGAAEGSVRIVAFAQEEGSVIRGTWGSADIDYMIWLELKHGSALRNAADQNYPNLDENIRGAYKS